MNLIDKIANEIMTQRAKIIDDFCKVYLASFDKKYFLKLKKEDFRRLELVETINSATERTYRVKLLKGVLPKKIIKK